MLWQLDMQSGFGYRLNIIGRSYKNKKQKTKTKTLDKTTGVTSGFEKSTPHTMLL